MKIRRNSFSQGTINVFRKEWHITLEGMSTASTESDARHPEE